MCMVLYDTVSECGFSHIFTSKGKGNGYIKLCSSAYFCLSKEACQRCGIKQQLLSHLTRLLISVFALTIIYTFHTLVLSQRSTRYVLVAPPHPLSPPPAPHSSQSFSCSPLFTFVLSTTPNHVLHFPLLWYLCLTLSSFFSLLRPVWALK